jgi:hypothetical protein
VVGRRGASGLPHGRVAAARERERRWVGSRQPPPEMVELSLSPEPDVFLSWSRGQNKWANAIAGISDPVPRPHMAAACPFMEQPAGIIAKGTPRSLLLLFSIIYFAYIMLCLIIMVIKYTFTCLLLYE